MTAILLGFSLILTIIYPSYKNTNPNPPFVGSIISMAISLDFNRKHPYIRDKNGFWGWLKRPLKTRPNLPSLHESFFEGIQQSRQPRRAVREGEKNLQVSETIPKNLYKAF